MSDVYLYAIGPVDGPVKIGISRDPYKRLVQIQTACPFPVKLLHAQPCESRKIALEDEAFLHRHHANEHMHGEWFHIVGWQAIEGVRDTVFFGEVFRKRAREGTI